MKLSSRARHAVRLMQEISRYGGVDNPVQLSEVARVTGLSKRFLEQLAMPLKSHSLLKGFCGRNGGYCLARPADEITIGDVMTALMGPITLAVCAADPTICMSSDFCSSRLVWALLQSRIDQVLNEYTIADLLDRDWLRSIRQELVSSSTMPTFREQLSQSG